MLTNPPDYRQPSPTSQSRKWPVLAVICRGVGRKSAQRIPPISDHNRRNAIPLFRPTLFAAGLRGLSHPQLAELGTAANALGQGERHLAGVVISDEHYRHPAPIEPDDVPRAAVYLELDGGNGGSIEFYHCLLPAADTHLLDPAGVRAHQRVGAEKLGRPWVGRMNRRWRDHDPLRG